MLRMQPGLRLTLCTLLGVWLLNLSVSRVHAQEQAPGTPPVSVGEPQPSAAPVPEPASSIRLDQPWKPKRFPRLYPRPRQLRPTAQARDTELAPQDEVELPERDSDLLVAGATTFVLSYMITVGFAAMVVGPIHQEDCDAGDTTVGCNDASLMMIPIVGPWLTTGSGNKGLFAVLSLAQVTGLVLTLVGISKYANSAESRRGWAANHALQLYAGPLQGGAFAATRLSF